MTSFPFLNEKFFFIILLSNLYQISINNLLKKPAGAIYHFIIIIIIITSQFWEKFETETQGNEVQLLGDADGLMEHTVATVRP